ncbi:MAG: hypothetical protein P1V20_21800 [Verrucomicrobiales bacterium]|nr:hypothetical protein [Verrucomicrobiales bacterium]
MKLTISVLVILFAGCFFSRAAELSSENNYKLKAVYDALPKTDGNRDGILTLGELRSYVEMKFKDHATSRSNFYLGKFLKNEPESDQNHDGILTKSELLFHLREPT